MACYIEFFLLLVICYWNFGFALNIEDVEKLFVGEKCIEGNIAAFAPLSQDIGIMKADMNYLGNDWIESDIQVAVLNSSSKSHDKSILSKLNELVQYNNIESKFTLLKEEGPPHNKLFKVQLELGDEVYEGEDKTLKNAQRNAAKIALQNTAYEFPSSKPQEEKYKVLTPTVKLNNIAAKLGVSVEYVLDDNKGKILTLETNSLKNYQVKINETVTIDNIPIEDQKFGPYNVKVKVDETEFYGWGHTIQAAKHDAALKAIEGIKREASIKNNPCSDYGSEEDCRKQKENIKSPISKIYEAAQKHDLEVSFDVVKESGPAHKKEFTVQCKLGDFITEGEGITKKKAKTYAAEKMLENLSSLPIIIDDTNSIVRSLKPKKKKKKKKLNSVSIEREANKDDAGSEFGIIAGDDDEKKLDKKDNKSKYSQKQSKQLLLNTANLLNFEVNFHDLGSNGKHFYSLVSMGLKPSFLCLGKGSDTETSFNRAAFEGLKLFSSSNLINKMSGIGEKNHLELVLKNIRIFLREQEISGDSPES